MAEKPFAVSEYAFDLPLFAKFYSFHIQKSRKKWWSILIYFCVSAGVVSGLVALIFLDIPEFFGLTLLLTLALLLKLFLDFVRPRIFPKPLYKNSPALNDATHSIELYEDLIKGKSTGPNTSENIEAHYSSLAGAYETDDMFYLYLNKHQACIIPKDTIDTKAGIKLSDILVRDLGKKFKTCGGTL